MMLKFEFTYVPFRKSKWMVEMVHGRITAGKTTVVSTAAVL
jgi:hypothetical protein